MPPITVDEKPWYKDWRSWAKIGVGVAVVGAGYYFAVRPLSQQIAETQQSIAATRREVGIKPGMTQAVLDRAWDRYYAKRGLMLTRAGDLVRRP